MILATIWADVRTNWKTMLVHGFVFAMLFQLFTMIVLIIRFQDVPNYVVAYDWFGHVAQTLHSATPWRDAIQIIWNEWLLEIGFKNHDFGRAIPEWSLHIVPSRLAVLFALGAMVSLALSLLQRSSCDAQTTATVRATTGLGAVLIAITNATISWIVCCATPSWVVGLAVLGLGVSTSLSLEHLGPILTLLGFATLAVVIVVLAAQKARTHGETRRRTVS